MGSRLPIMCGGGTQDSTILKGGLRTWMDRFAVGRICVVAGRGLITDNNVAEVETAGRLAVRHQAATPQRPRCGPCRSCRSRPGRIDRGRAVRSRVLETTYEGAATWWCSLARVNVVPPNIAAAAATILAGSPVKRLLEASDVAEGRLRMSRCPCPRYPSSRGSP